MYPSKTSAKSSENPHLLSQTLPEFMSWKLLLVHQHSGSWHCLISPSEHQPALLWPRNHHKQNRVSGNGFLSCTGNQVPMFLHSCTFLCPTARNQFPSNQKWKHWCKHIGIQKIVQHHLQNIFNCRWKSQLDFGVQSELLAGSILPLKNYNFLLNYELFPLELPCSQLNQVEPP